ncbi:MAG: response regulator transcription factor [Clostridia bacterium]|nr:response regulator transcription factor [Clostridia bacterium]
MSGKVFLLEDDKSICELVKCSLEMQGIEIEYFNTVGGFMRALENERPDVAVLDIMLEDGNGYDVLTKIKHKYSDVCCIMLSALGSETDIVKGLNLGADDYITKPFGVLEFSARIKVAFRHTASAMSSAYGIDVDSETHEVKLNGSSVKLNNKEFRLVSVFINNPNKVLSRDFILNSVWGYSDVESRTLDNHIARLRRAGFTNIETIVGVGYRMADFK